jgi:hypothetical protein
MKLNDGKSDVFKSTCKRDISKNVSMKSTIPDNNSAEFLVQVSIENNYTLARSNRRNFYASLNHAFQQRP